MLAALGTVAPELMSMTGAIPMETGLPWFEGGGLFSASGEWQASKRSPALVVQWHVSKVMLMSVNGMEWIGWISMDAMDSMVWNGMDSSGFQWRMDAMTSVYCLKHCSRT